MIEKIVLFALSTCLIWGWALAYFINKIEDDDIKGWCYFNLLFLLIKLTLSAGSSHSISELFNTLVRHPWLSIVFIVIQGILLIVHIKNEGVFSNKDSRRYDQAEEVFKGFAVNFVMSVYMGGFVAICYYVVYGAIIAPLFQKFFS